MAPLGIRMEGDIGGGGRGAVGWPSRSAALPFPEAFSASARRTALARQARARSGLSGCLPPWPPCGPRFRALLALLRGAGMLCPVAPDA